jgi:trimethylamine--corrinoid protein Co-methyltransferase
MAHDNSGQMTGGVATRPALRPAGRSGRAGRHEARSHKVSPVRPGLSGGQYRPLTDRDLERIHDTALTVLAELGMAEATQEIIDIALPKGCTLGDDGRLRFPRGVIEDVVAGAAKSYVLHGRDPARDIEVGGDRVHFCTSGEGVRILDFHSGQYRPSTLVDLYDLQRLAGALEHIHNVGQTVVATDLDDAYVHDLNVAYASAAATTKPFGMSTATASHVAEIIALFDMILGGEGRFQKRPFCVIGGCPIVSPLRFGKHTSEVMVATTRAGLVADMCVATQAGATSPAALAGTLVQTVAETLACLAIVNFIRPGHPMHLGLWPFVSDLRTGAFTGGGGEEALLQAASAQIARFYGLPSSISAGMTDAKRPDGQAGFEKGITVALAATAGGNLISEVAGMVGSLMGASFETMVIDNEMLGNIQRTLKGIEVTDESLSYEVIKEVISGPGHYLGHPQTLELMDREYLYPGIADRSSLSAWEEDGSPGILDKARKEAKRLLSTHYPQSIDPAADEAIRARFPIRLAQADMRPGNGRW